MPFETIRSVEFEELIRDAILRRDTTVDVAEGEIADVVISPPAAVFERVHDRVVKLSNLITLSRPSEFQGAFQIDLDAIVYNERVIRSAGTAATAVVVFSTPNAPNVDIVIQRGFPIGTLPSEATGATITFVTTEEKILRASTAGTFRNPTTGRYEISVPVVAIARGSSGRVGAGRITKTLRPIAAFDTVTNLAPSEGGRGAETNDDLIRRYFLSIVGRRLTTQRGLLKAVLDLFPDVVDTLPVFGDDPLLERGGNDAGAVDCYILGEQSVTTTENIVYLGPNQLLQVSLPPLLRVVSVRRLAGGAAFAERDNTAGTGSYTVVRGVGIKGSSTQSQDGIIFHSNAASFPTVGALVSVTYTYNNLVRRVQSTFDEEDLYVHGRDLLFREAARVEMAHTATLTVSGGATTSIVKNAVKTAVLRFFEGLKLGANVEGSDIQAVVRAISGVDNYVITRLTRLADPTGTTDVSIAKNEYARLDEANFILS